MNKELGLTLTLDVFKFPSAFLFITPMININIRCI